MHHNIESLPRHERTERKDKLHWLSWLPRKLKCLYYFIAIVLQGYTTISIHWLFSLKAVMHRWFWIEYYILSN